MRIPHVLVNLTGSNANSSSQTRPRYEVALLRRLWAGRLADHNGLEVVEYPDYRPDDNGRYHEIESVQAEENVLRKQYGPIFNEVYPEGLAKEINALLLEEVEKATKHGKTEQAKAAVRPHESFLKAGCTAAQALALQTAGYESIAKTQAAAFLDIAQIPGITPTLAQVLTAPVKFQAKPAE